MYMKELCIKRLQKKLETQWINGFMINHSINLKIHIHT